MDDSQEEVTHESHTAAAEAHYQNALAAWNQAQRGSDPLETWKALVDLNMAGQSRTIAGQATIIAELLQRVGTLEEAVTTLVAAQVGSLQAQMMHDADPDA